MKPVTRRQILKGLLSVSVGAAGVSVLAACGGATPAAPEAPAATVAASEEEAPATTAPVAAAGEVKEIEWWFGWSGCGLPEIADAFMAKNPDIKVNWVDQGYGFQGKLMAAIAAGNPPGLAYNVQYMELAARGLMVPMDEYIAASDEVSLTDGDIPASVWEMFSWQGKHYGIPVGGDYTLYAIGYNLNLVEQAGLNPEQLPETWDEVFEWHKALTTYDNAGNIDILGYAPTMDSSASAHAIAPWVYPQMWGFSYFDPKALTYDIDRPETVEFLEVINGFWQDVGPEKIAALGKSMEGQGAGAFGAGKQGMYIGYASTPATVYKINPDHTYKFTWVPVPSSRRGQKVVTVGGHASTILKGSKNPEATFKLCVFNSQKEACDILFDKVGWVGVRRSFQETVDLSKYPEHVAENIWFYAHTQLEEGTDIRAVPDPIGSITDAEWKNMREAVIYGDFTPEQAAQRMQEKMTEEISNWQKEQSES